MSNEYFDGHTYGELILILILILIVKFMEEYMYKTITINVRAYRYGVMIRKLSETFKFQAEECRELLWEGAWNDIRKVVGVAETWMRGLRTAHYYATQDTRVQCVSLYRTLSEATFSITVFDTNDCEPVMQEVINDLNEQSIPLRWC